MKRKLKELHPPGEGGLDTHNGSREKKKRKKIKHSITNKSVNLPVTEEYYDTGGESNSILDIDYDFEISELQRVYGIDSDGSNGDSSNSDSNNRCKKKTHNTNEKDEQSSLFMEDFDDVLECMTVLSRTSTLDDKSDRTWVSTFDTSNVALRGKVKNCIDENTPGVKKIDSIFKSLATCGVQWMEYQIESFIKILKAAIPQIFYTVWDLMKIEILEFYGIVYIKQTVVLNIPRQLGKTFAVAILIKYLLLHINGDGRENPFSIMIPGLYRSTYEDFIERVCRSFSEHDLHKFIVKESKREIKLINRRNKSDVRRMFGGSTKSDVSINIYRGKLMNHYLHYLVPAQFAHTQCCYQHCTLLVCIIFQYYFKI